MELKRILEGTVTELENTLALLAAIQAALIEQKLIDENQIKKEFPSLLSASQDRLAGLRNEISKLSA